MKYTNCSIPDSIRKEAEVAMGFYPKLADTEVNFKFASHIRKNFMQAQPTWQSFFKSRKYRAYNIFISRAFQVEDQIFSIDQIPSDVLIGWLGHELGHVMDYRERSGPGMVVFGFKYLYSHSHIKEVERTADEFAVRHGMADYILKTKNFILNNSSLSEKYKNRIKQFYLSPEEIAEICNQYAETGEKPKLDEIT